MSDTNDTSQRALTKDFEDESFAILNRAMYDEYIGLRVHGYHANVSFRRVFGEEYSCDEYTSRRIEAIERNPYYKRNFDARLNAIKIGELWDEKVAVHELLMMARDVYAKDSTRLNAIKELNILTHIVIVDENGKTKARRTLADFYKDEGLVYPPEPPVGTKAEDDAPKPPTTH